ncbi:MAG: hypothetical protein R3B09_27275 [Nannocystaceae bacterium]
MRPEARSWLRSIATPLGDNQRWYDNLAGDFAWSCARRHVDPALRRPLDAWFGHLFWDAEDEGCNCGREPRSVGDDAHVLDDALLHHLLDLEAPLDPIADALTYEFGGDPPRTERLHRPWIYDPDGFVGLVDEHQRIITQARRAGPGWSLLRWVWY